MTGGEIRVLGDSVVGAKERDLRRIRGGVIGLVPQDPMVSLNPTLRIGTQVAEAVRRRGGVDRRQLSAEVVAALEKAGLDNAVRVARQYPHALSGGMRQRVLIAIALAGEPQLLIADEPTSALDVTLQRRILDHLEGLVRDSGVSLLIITHDLGVAADRADRVVVMRKGEVVEEGVPSRVLVAPRHPYSHRLIEAAVGLSPDLWPVTGPGRSDSAGSSAGTSPQAAVSSNSGSAPAPAKAGDSAAPEADEGSQEPREILRLDHVTKDFPLPPTPGGPRTLRAVDDVSLTVRAGRTLALVGESGSGKTTTLRVALGLEDPTAGEVHFDGQRISGRSWREVRPLRQRFQLVHQNPYASLDPKLSLYDTIVEPLVSFRIGNSASRQARARELLDQVALPQTMLHRRPAELSGGERQRIAIARALALKPDLLLLDEPVSALDVSIQAQILDLLRELQGELGLAYLFISHDLAVVAQVAHEVAVMRDGAVLESGPTRGIFTDPRSDYTRELIEAIPGRRAAATLPHPESHAGPAQEPAQEPAASAGQ
ncbi:ABC transporter ATP-binding protein [Actinacidiphila oryziradicis]|uniref:ABC transporter ATP-binding protein n=1 Tax=Actinacidiphila oryziradicis TaxID=2571141 RepID=A0A4U0RQH0_9ACTN|nr:ABC transporter ATP-binding protein [Actinacidiphila oryziradicis]